MKIKSLKTKKKTLRVETFHGGKVNMDLDVIKEVGNKILYKTFTGLKELTLQEDKGYWFLSNSFKGDSVPKEWENFIICQD